MAVADGSASSWKQLDWFGHWSGMVRLVGSSTGCCSGGGAAGCPCEHASAGCPALSASGVCAAGWLLAVAAAAALSL
jgi:hypothetical protein